MTPQERQLVAELFDRLARLEGAPRDPQAEAAIADALARAPHAVYALVQTTLVQDEALKRADARIRELEGELGIEQPDGPRERGFLDSMRDALFGESAQPRGSVPSVGNRPMGVPPGFRTADPAAAAGPADAPERGRGGSFLGTAAAAAAGVIGGSLLLDGIRSAWGSAPQADKAGAFDAGAGESRSPWGGEGGGDLARQAGLDDIGRGGAGAAGQEHGYGLFNGDDETGLAEDYEDFDLGDGGDVL